MRCATVVWLLVILLCQSTLAQDTTLRLKVKPSRPETDLPAKLRQTVQVLQRRLDAAGTLDLRIRIEAPDHLIVTAPAAMLDASIRERLTQAPCLELRESKLDLASGATIWVKALGGNILQQAEWHPSAYGQAEVALQLTAEAKQAFAELTTRLLDKQLGIFLDGRLVSAPLVRTPIHDGKLLLTFGPLEGTREAESLTDCLNACIAPLHLELEAENRP